MALRTAIRSARWGDANPLTNAWGAAPPAGADTFATAGFVVTVDTIDGPLGCAGGTITLGGELKLQSTAGFTLTGAVAHNGKFSASGSGSNAVPTLMTMNGCIWTCGVAAIWNVVGTLPYTGPDVKMVGNATSYFQLLNRTGITGAITKTQYDSFSNVNGVFARMASSATTNLVLSDILFSSCLSVFIGAVGQFNSVYFSGTIYITNSLAAGIVFSFYYLFGSATVIIASSATTTTAGVSSSIVGGSVVVNINEKAGGSRVSLSSFVGTSRLIILDVDSDSAINRSSFLENSSLLLSTTTANRVFLNDTAGTSSYALTALGSVEISNSAAGMSIFLFFSYFVLSRTKITVAGGTVILCRSFANQERWQASRSSAFKIIGATAITPRGSGAVAQYEPCLYIYNEATNLFGIQYDLDAETPNYTALYGTSTLWTSTTKTLAAGGVLIINSTGHTATGMDMAISSFAGFALATTGTAAHTDLYNISFDGGILWSGDLTLAQLQSNSYIINGNNYNTDGNYNIQLRIKLTSAAGGTITQVAITGITYNPSIVSSWTVRGNLEDISGAGFVTGTHDLKSIHDDISTGNTTIIALITALSGVVTVALQPILGYVKKIWNYLQGHSKIRIDRNEKQ